MYVFNIYRLSLNVLKREFLKLHFALHAIYLCGLYLLPSTYLCMYKSVFLFKQMHCY